MRRYGVDGFKFDAGDAMYYEGLVPLHGMLMEVTKVLDKGIIHSFRHDLLP